ncbi:MAG: alanine racemase [Cyanobacteria bacterium J06642_2]
MARLDSEPLETVRGSRLVAESLHKARLHVNPSLPVASQLDLTTQRAWVEVDLAAIRHNVRVLRALLQPGTQLWAVVKANAYGHGAVPVSRAAIAAGASGLCVATLPEGLELRQACIEIPILILGPLNTAPEIELAVAHELELTVTTEDAIALCERVGVTLQRPIPIHLNVDTGMTRLGISPERAAPCWHRMISSPDLEARSLYSHFATADELDHPAIQEQSDRFASIVRELRDRDFPAPTLHLANSAAALAGSQWHYHLVRVGLALYGYAPAPHLSTGGALRPAMSVKARIAQLKTSPAGIGVSYGHRYVTTSQQRLATVAIGYADGVPRCLSGRLRSCVSDYPVQQVGTITMDQTLWDASQVPIDNVAIGMPIAILNPDYSAQHWADLAGTIPYEILCGFSARLPRYYVDSEKETQSSGEFI